MSSLENILDVPGVHEALAEFERGMADIDPQVLPKDPKSLSSFIIRSMHTLDQVIDGHNARQKHDIRDEDIEGIKAEVEDDFYDVKSKTSAASEHFTETGGAYGKQEILDILLDYAAGYHAYTQLCTGSQLASLVDTWNRANAGDQVNCLQLVTSQNDIEMLIKASFVPSHPSTKESFLQKIWAGRRLGFGPFALYQRDPSRAYAGMGIYAEGLIPVKPESPFVVGTTFQVFLRNSYDTAADSPFKGELKTTEWSFIPPILEGGYDTKNFGVFILGGLWFTAAIVPDWEKENTPYSSQFFENPNYLVGGKLTTLNHRLGVEGAYLHTPWGPGYVANANVDLNFWRRKK